MDSTVLDVLKGLVSKTYKFFAPTVSATSTAVDDAVIIELARQSGTSINAVTNGLGKCVGYTASNIAISNGESTAVGTVIDFASRQVVVTEELAANTAVAGGGTVAIGSTATEVAATTTTTTMMGATVASVGACVLSAIAGYELGKTIGNQIAEKYPDFWVDKVGKSLYDAGCTISSTASDAVNGMVITYMNQNGETNVPKKAVSVIKNELADIGVIQSDGASTLPNTSKYGEWYEKIKPITSTYSYTTNTKFDVTFSNGKTFTYLKDRGVILSNLPINFIGIYTNVLVPEPSQDYEQFTIYAYVINNSQYNESNLAIYNEENGDSGLVYRDKENKDRAISISYILSGNFELDDADLSRYIAAFETQVAPIKYIIERMDIDCWREHLLASEKDLFSDNYLDIINRDGVPKLDPAKEPAPVTVPAPKIHIGDTPSDDEDSKAIPVPGIVPELNPAAIPTPKIDPVISDEPIAENPTPFPKIKPRHLPDLPDPVPKKPTKPPIPIVPDMIASALSRVYNPTQAQLDALGQYLWSGGRIEDLLKIFQNPADAIISLHAIYGTPTVGGESEIKLGYLGTGVSAQVVTSQFVVINCGTITIEEKYKNATDYPPYTSVQIYLPFIGIQTLNPFDIIDSSITCTYKIDVYTGACIAQLNVERSGLDGVIYEFSGNCAYTIPLTSTNYAQFFANVVGGVIGGAMLGGPGGAVLGGGRALVHSNLEVGRSGNLSANAGILGTRKPYFIITRSIPHDALNYSNFYGYPSNKTVYLNDCTGYTRVKDIILHTSATQEERDEIMKLLKNGVYI